MRAIVFVALSVFLAGCPSGGVVIVDGHSYGGGGLSVEARESRALAFEGATKLQVSDDAGNVTVDVAPTASFSLDIVKRAPKSEDLPKLEVQVAREGAVVRVTFVRPATVDRAEADLTLHIPASLELDLETQAGNVTASGTTSGARAKAGAGNVTVHAIAGRLDVESGAGNVIVEDAVGEVAARSSAGNVQLSGRPTKVRAESGAGNVTVDGAHGQVVAASQSGNVTVSGVLSGASKVSSGAGNVSVAIPADSDLAIHAHTGAGTIANDFGFPVEGVASVDASGKLGKGTHSLEVESGAGDVRLLRR